MPRPRPDWTPLILRFSARKLTLTTSIVSLQSTKKTSKETFAQKCRRRALARSTNTLTSRVINAIYAGSSELKKTPITSGGARLVASNAVKVWTTCSVLKMESQPLAVTKRGHKTLDNSHGETSTMTGSLGLISEQIVARRSHLSRPQPQRLSQRKLSETERTQHCSKITRRNAKNRQERAPARSINTFISEVNAMS